MTPSDSPPTSPTTVRHLGIVGGGQLGRMLALAAAPLGLETTVLDPKSSPGARPHAAHVAAAFDDRRALESLADDVDALTWEFENISVDALADVVGHVPVHPPLDSLRISGDRAREKEFFEQLGIGVAPWTRVDTRDDLGDARSRHGLPLVVKRRRMGYDGKGQRICRTESQLDAAWEALGDADLVAEGFVDYERELSVIGVGGADGEVRIYPPVANLHRAGILIESRAPAPASDSTVDRAQSICRATIRQLDYVGVVAIELFDTGDDLWVNEMAPRVHNSGHWSIEGAETSQFENHVRAVAGLPLGACDVVAPTRMFNAIGGFPDRAEVLAVDGAHLHSYRKSARPGRKIGHVTVRAGDAQTLESRIDRVRPLVEAVREL